MTQRKRYKSRGKLGGLGTGGQVVLVGGVLILGAMFISGGTGGVFKVLSDLASNAGSGIQNALTSLGIGGAAGYGGSQLIKAAKSPGGGSSGSDSSKGGGKPSDSGKGGSDSGKGKPLDASDFQNLDPTQNPNLSKIKAPSQQDINNLKKSGSKSPSKTDRTKKSDNQKKHQTNDKTKKGSDNKGGTKVPAKDDCVIKDGPFKGLLNPLCSIQNLFTVTPENAPKLSNPLDALKIAPLNA